MLDSQDIAKAKEPIPEREQPVKRANRTEMLGHQCNDDLTRQVMAGERTVDRDAGLNGAAAGQAEIGGRDREVGRHDAGLEP